MSEKTLPAQKENFELFMEFINREAKAIGFSKSQLYKVNLASEEAIVNIINYAYKDYSDGTLTVICSTLTKDNIGLGVDLIDSGTPFNPLENRTPDTTLAIEEREIGGLGVHMIKKSCSKVEYSGENGENHLTMIFNLDEPQKELKDE